MTLLAGTDSSSDRALAWWRLLVAFLLVAVFAAGSISYARLFANASESYQLLPRGASHVQEGAEYRIISLRQSLEARDDSKGLLSATANAMWVVAEVDVVLEQPNTEFYCDRFDLLGSHGRRFQADNHLYRPDRNTPCGPEDITVGRPFRYELVYVVPTRDVSQLYGLVQDDYVERRHVILRPA